MNQQMIILGAKRSKGQMDNGTKYDSTKLYVQVQMEPKDGQVGFSCDDYNWGDSSNFEKIKDLKFPFVADVDIQLTTNGKTTKMAIFDLKPVPTK